VRSHAFGVPGASSKGSKNTLNEGTPRGKIERGLLSYKEWIQERNRKR